MFVEFGFADHPFLHEVGHQLQVLDILAHGVVVFDPRFDGRHFAQLFARRGRVVPEVGFLGLLLFVAQVDAFLFDVQAAFEGSAAGPELLDLFGEYHKSVFKSSFCAANRRISSAVASMPSTEVLTHRSYEPAAPHVRML